MFFNLLEEPWLPVMPRDGTQIEEVSLAGLLGHARSYRCLAGSTPTMTAALYRVVLALIHRVYGPESLSRWGELWRAENGFPGRELAAYAAAYGDRFDLFDARRPFFQCPALDAKKASSTAQLVAYRAAGIGRTLFDHTTAADSPALPPAEAARWLITAQMYDTGGLKTQYTKTKGSKAGLGNRFACAVVEGQTLHETLLLNTVVYDPAAEQPWMTTGRDRPVWEADEPPDPEPDERPPHGWTDLLTWPSRRILLKNGRDGRDVLITGVVLTPGTRLKADLADVELMAAFSRPWLKGSKRGPLEPVLLQDVTGVWRHSRDLLLAADPLWRSTSARRAWRRGTSMPVPAGEPERRRPAPLDQIAAAADEALIPDRAVYTLRVFGQQLRGRNAATHAWYEEAIPAPVALIRAADERVGHLIGQATTLAAGLGAALGEMQRSYHRAAGGRTGSTERKREDAVPTILEIEYWPRLAAPFAGFIRELGAAVANGDSEQPALNRWAAGAAQVADSAARTWLHAIPRHDRMLLQAVTCHEDYQRVRQARIRIFHSGVAAFTAPEPETAA
jgi:CRISPR system Cascade subunit CasA